MPRERGYRRTRDASASEREERRQRDKHRSTDSGTELLGETRRRESYHRDSPGTSPRKYRREENAELDSDYDGERERAIRRQARREERRRQRQESGYESNHRERVVETTRVYESDRNPEVDRYADRERRREEKKRRALEEEEDEHRRRRRAERRRERQRDESRRRLVVETESSNPTDSHNNSSNALSAGSLAALNALNAKLGHDGGPQRIREEVNESEVRYREEKRKRREEERRRRAAAIRDPGPDVYDEYLAQEKRYEIDRVSPGSRMDRKGRVVSGQRLERGGSEFTEKTTTGLRWWRWHRGGGGGGGGRDGGRGFGGSITSSYLSAEERALQKKRRKRTLIILAIIIVVLAIAIPVGIVVSKKDSSSNTNHSGSTSSGKPSNSNLNGLDPNSVPSSDKGGWLDPWSWYDTSDFNVTFTDVMVGGLPIIGLNSTWDDSTRANSNVPPLNQAWKYGTMPIRGINVGGWFSLEPLITPSFFSKFKTSDGVVDEYTLTAKLGSSTAKSTLEQHYATFIVEEDFANMQAAGFDHVRIPFSYWAVTTYQGDPYVAQVSWRYILRCIEWCRKYGLRVNLDLHGAPGSQNGWNHSGRQGVIAWLNGTSGTQNGDRTIAIHDQLSKFFAQDRYKNVITIYGLVNEPRMTFLDTSTVMTWTRSAVSTIRGNGITAQIAFGDGFMGLDNWQGKLTDVKDLILDVHQYVIFNVQQLSLDHQDKTKFACGGWTSQALRSMNTATGFGPTMFAEWSQADTDCATYLNNVGVGSRWEGTLNMVNTPGGSTNGSVLTPQCPTNNSPRCSCQGANADPAAYSAVYKQWLLQFAEAQMYSFEKGWGWFYWTWKTESAAQWSYSSGLANGILPTKTWERSFNCSDVPDYASLGLAETY